MVSSDDADYPHDADIWIKQLGVAVARTDQCGGC
jgi:hypothetical protein